MTSIKPIIISFFEYAKTNKIEIYNEFSFQHELGVFLREKMDGYKVQFERNVSDFEIGGTIKKEIDIVVLNPAKKEKFAIELKYPRNGQYPEQMYSFVKDIKFMEQLQRHHGFQHTYCLVLVDDPLFHSGSMTEGIYKHFRGENRVYGCINKPTGKGKDDKRVELEGEHLISWEDAEVFVDKSEKPKKCKYYCIEF